MPWLTGGQGEHELRDLVDPGGGLRPPPRVGHEHRRQREDAYDRGGDAVTGAERGARGRVHERQRQQRGADPHEQVAERVDPREPVGDLAAGGRDRAGVVRHRDDPVHDLEPIVGPRGGDQQPDQSAERVQDELALPRRPSS